MPNNEMSKHHNSNWLNCSYKNMSCDSLVGCGYILVGHRKDASLTYFFSNLPGIINIYIVFIHNYVRLFCIQLYYCKNAKNILIT